MKRKITIFIGALILVFTLFAVGCATVKSVLYENKELIQEIVKEIVRQLLELAKPEATLQGENRFVPEGLPAEKLPSAIRTNGEINRDIVTYLQRVSVAVDDPATWDKIESRIETILKEKGY